MQMSPSYEAGVHVCACNAKARISLMPHHVQSPCTRKMYELSLGTFSCQLNNYLFYNDALTCFMPRWKPAQRMTPEEAMHHTWLQETHAHKARQRIKTAPKLSDKPFNPPEKKKENVHKNAPPERGDLGVLSFHNGLDP